MFFYENQTFSERPRVRFPSSPQDTQKTQDTQNTRCCMYGEQRVYEKKAQPLKLRLRFGKR